MIDLYAMSSLHGIFLKFFFVYCEILLNYPEVFLVARLSGAVAEHDVNERLARSAIAWT